MARLRAPDGCPWDRTQTLESLRTYLIEEVYETLEAIDAQDFEQHREELGDVLLQIVFQSQLAEELGHFNIDDVVDGLAKKLIRRHPHVFGQAEAQNAQEVVVHWERIKQEEKSQGQSNNAPKGLLDSVPKSLPALLLAHRLGQRAARVGFDWQKPWHVFDKVKEELGELEEVLTQAPPDRTQLDWEIGDLLFSVCQLARHFDLDAESALQQTNRRFQKRFGLMEKLADKQGIDLSRATSDQLEQLWQTAKQQLG